MFVFAPQSAAGDGKEEVLQPTRSRHPRLGKVALPGSGRKIVRVPVSGFSIFENRSLYFQGTIFKLDKANKTSRIEI